MNLADPDSGEPVEIPMLPLWVDNWVRLGLVEVHYVLLTASGEDSYDWAEGRPEVMRAREELSGMELGRGILMPTQFGKAFAVAVAPHDFEGDAPPI